MSHFVVHSILIAPKLDRIGAKPQKQGRVHAQNNSFYAQYRVRSGAVPLLRDDQDYPPERLLQSIWQHQRLLRDRLQTLDGRPVRVLHPGFRSVEGGPDFRAALVQFGDEPARSGDVEVDLRAAAWRGHHHDRNPAFQNVVLHVLWDGADAAAGGPPALPLRQVLDAPLGELSLWLGGEAGQELPEELRGDCCAPLSRLTADQAVDLLHQAARVRLESKAAQFQARARQAGWEQALWEGLFRALGYKHNTWAMQRLAELRPRWARPETRLPALQARLFGISGLLPPELTRRQAATDAYLRQIWDLWWRERDEFVDCLLPRELWRLHGLRPANHPQRRLALGASWTAAANMTAALERWCASEIPEPALGSSLLKGLQVADDQFWSWHWTFRSAALKSPHPLLGAARVTDLAVNVILPWLWVRAREGGNEKVLARVERRYFAWPAAEDNSVLRLARQRLLGTVSARRLPGAAAQQGLMQMVRDFCDHSNSICEACKLPGLVQEFAADASARADL